MRMFLGLALWGGCGGGGSDATPDAKAPPNTGFVQLSSQTFMASGTTVRDGVAVASFTIPNGAPICNEEKVGPCTVIDCFGNTQPQPATAFSAGTITATGAAIPITLTPGPDKTYARVASNTQPFFMGDETLAISGTGADVPAFSVSVTAPSRPTITSPSPPSTPSQKLDVNRAQGFRATWMNRTAAGKVVLYLSGPTNTAVSMSCEFDSSALAGEIPAAALALLPVGTGTFSASAVSYTTTDVGEWRVYGEGFFNAVWPDETYATAMVNIH